MAELDPLLLDRHYDLLGILLKRCIEADPSIRSYLDIAERAFGKMTYLGYKE